MKDLLARKGKAEETSKITLNERRSAVLLNKILFKEKDPGSFTIPCVIGKMGNEKTLADLGANIIDDICLSIDMVDEGILEHGQETLPSNPLNSFLFEPVINYQQRNTTNLWGDKDDDLDDSKESGSSSDHDD
ncbi:hypothetical protein Tco_0795822 [Tanacetum coccineum]